MSVTQWPCLELLVDERNHTVGSFEASAACAFSFLASLHQLQHHQAIQYWPRHPPRRSAAQNQPNGTILYRFCNPPKKEDWQCPEATW